MTCFQREPVSKAELRDRIQAYLIGGGLFNPELAIHDNVRDLIMDFREYLDAQELANAPETSYTS